MLRLFVILFLAFQVVACMKIEDDESPKPQTPASSSPVVTAATENKSADAGSGSGSIPQLILDHDITLNSVWIDQLSKVQKLILQKNVHIYSLDQNVNLHLHEVQSGGAEFTTFLSGQTAKQGSAGRSGGMIKLEIEKLSGDFTVTMIGENGGKGLNGADGKIPTTVGANGDYGYFEMERSHFRGIDEAGEPVAVCKRAATAPAVGADGGDGEAGGAGFAGGDSGLLRLRVFEKSEGAKIKLRVVKSAGGVGGDGGKGAAIGGPGGTRIGSPNVCFTSGSMLDKQASSGKPGRPGAIGPAGVSGNAQSACVQIANDPMVCTAQAIENLF